ncbi:MAG: nicotinate (nicotinamide) nucleotide adenylyltransferase [Defluviitaleaceae bacterium]|nr:nicotinate (nicotinamide) nucleotide adenylyltransferase [Defluviitaleaceae bacterium]
MIAVFGGAFNPPTLAHEQIAKHVLNLPGIEKLLFVPVGDHYEKVGLISADHRMQMLEILIEKLPGASLSKVEVEAKRALKSIETLEQLQLDYPGVDLAFVMGADNLLQLMNWHHHERFIQTVKIMILNRGHVDVSRFISDHFEAAVDRFIIVNDFEKMVISSSTFRADQTKKDHVRPEIDAYIQQHRLYQARETL